MTLILFCRISVRFRVNSVLQKVHYTTLRGTKIVADIVHADTIPSNTFDCIILIQTVLFVYDLPSAVNHFHHIFKPGGVLLATIPGISQVSCYDVYRWDELWRFTTQSAQRLFEKELIAMNVEVEAYGNGLIAIALLYGLAVEELKPEHFEYPDPDYQVLSTVQTVKSKVDD